ncbi:winged helix-turn-helix domain-containing protein [Micromonospora sp. WMMD1102]|uniref:winged helix-turn-helix domain-containing protein n=1 Tax=Micromonospora sp. WMMD1102 TaxID=3016105 RepID=UPI002415000F|nr:winged helix-turn-helix domain-containing protein [Micromonospora sp. WMMD1102]MDG4788828.1 winged helix-turn-helix domain-containing protein [Micromonospora sp. WMMD1102]
MGLWLLDADVLARSRFALSPLVEAIAALKSLDGHPTPPGQRAWREAHSAAYRTRLAGDPFTAAFVRAAFPPRWVPDFLAAPTDFLDRPADNVETTFAGELRRIRETPAEALRADLLAGLTGPLPRVLGSADLPERAAELLEWVWSHTLRPDWPRRQRLFEADIVSRTHLISSGGWAATLDGMRPGMRWLGNGRLQVNTYDLPPQDLGDTGLLFVPSTTTRGWVGSDTRGWVGSDQPHRHTVVYPCRGTLADPARIAPPAALSRLLGPIRADILARLESPTSTTQLVASTGHRLGSVGGHLRVLLDAQLVQRRRAGRYVLYSRTADGDRLVRISRRPVRRAAG